MRIAIDWAKRGREAAVLVGIGTFLAIINPYNALGTSTFLTRWIYWTGTIGAGAIIGLTVAHFILKWLGDRPGVLVFAAISIAVTFFLTPVLALIHYLMGDTTAFQTIGGLYIAVWVISAAMTALGWVLHKIRNPPPMQTGAGLLPDNEDKIRSFMSRLPLPYRNADLYALSSEDHYLRAHTSAGEHLFLERLSTAIHALDGANGLQTHRSWWVAEAGVKEARSQNGRITLVLQSGVEAPVSRTFAKAVREHGWV